MNVKKNKWTKPGPIHIAVIYIIYISILMRKKIKSGANKTQKWRANNGAHILILTRIHILEPIFEVIYVFISYELY